MRILENTHGHQDLIKLDEQQRKVLCQEIREFLIEHVSKTGGHVASNLGVVELTVAIETVFNTAKDRLVFDVGHQSYVHKLLTGRQADFHSLRQFGGISGFPKPSESDTDAFVAGHASSSVSIALGMARARTLMGESYHVVTLLGDGAATGGMVYEGLNDAAVSGEPMIVILNDNALSIDRNVGGVATHLRKLRTKERYLGIKKRYRSVMSKLPGGKAIYGFTHKVKDRIRRMLIPTTIFENMGFTYLGPVDGHDVENLIYLLRVSRDMRRPVLLHVITQKGKGYKPSEEHPKLFHGIGKFDPVTGEPVSKSCETFSGVFGKTMLELAGQNKRVCAVTAAMPGGTGLLEFKNQYPKRLFDVGIAEEHAVSMAGGLAKQGMIPVVAIYSTFLQRGFDQIMQDVALQQLHVVFAVDRADLVGEDGPTHHGVFDVGFLRQIPGMMVLCPWNFSELRSMLTWAVNEYTGPVAIRYPRGGEGHWPEEAECFCGRPGDFASFCWGGDLTLITYGMLTNQVLAAAKNLDRSGVHVRVIRLYSASHIPGDKLAEQVVGSHVIVIEETCSGSGLKETIGWELRSRGVQAQIHGLDLGGDFVTHGSLTSLYAHTGVNEESIVRFVHEVRHNEE